MSFKPNKPAQPYVVPNRWKNIEKQMEESRAWQTGPGSPARPKSTELGPHYDLKTGKRIQTQKEMRLQMEKEERARKFKEKVEEYKERAAENYRKGGMVNDSRTKYAKDYKRK
jgi:hypothetical protein